ncbi:adenylate kinase family protein [Tenacibaculum maritimum]|uniref:adenylate kinase family protein n=1 Tax=Tenacibaculum maritimum TaxID=107401 RepID=UPI003875BAAA
MNIIIFGPPLSGKGTQSKKIMQDFAIPHLSTGAILRIEKAKKTALGISAAGYSEKGLLVPDNIVSKIVESCYQDNKGQRGFLFDGYPRNIEQAKHLINVLQKEDALINLIIYLKVPKEVLLERALIRGREQNREDDKDSDIVIKRINEFSQFTIPAIGYIKETGVKVLEIDGTQSIEEIYAKINLELNTPTYQS